MEDELSLAADLLDTPERVWSSVECAVKPHCVVIYARLHAHSQLDLERALATSQRVLNTVLGERLQGRTWVAAVQWSYRVCRTFTPRGAAPSDRSTAIADGLAVLHPQGF
jgi:hypothetical protein